MAWVAINKYNREYIYEEKPKRCYCSVWSQTSLSRNVVELPKGSIKNSLEESLLGRMSQSNLNKNSL